MFLEDLSLPRVKNEQKTNVPVWETIFSYLRRLFSLSLSKVWKVSILSILVAFPYPSDFDHNWSFLDATALSGQFSLGRREVPDLANIMTE